MFHKLLYFIKVNEILSYVTVFILRISDQNGEYLKKYFFFLPFITFQM